MSTCVICSFLCELLFIGDKIADDSFKDEITTSLKVNDGLKFDQNVALAHVREKGKKR